MLFGGLGDSVRRGRFGFSALLVAPLDLVAHCDGVDRDGRVGGPLPQDLVAPTGTTPGHPGSRLSVRALPGPRLNIMLKIISHNRQS